MKLILINIFLLLCFFSNAQNSSTKYYENIKIDTVFNTSLKLKFQKYVENLIIEEGFDSGSILSSSGELLDTKEKATKFSFDLILNQFPEFNESMFEKINVSEDSLKLNWFIQVHFKENFSFPIEIIIIKANCRVLYFIKNK